MLLDSLGASLQGNTLAGNVEEKQELAKEQ